MLGKELGTSMWAFFPKRLSCIAVTCKHISCSLKKFKASFEGHITTTVDHLTSSKQLVLIAMQVRCSVDGHHCTSTCGNLSRSNERYQHKRMLHLARLAHVLDTSHDGSRAECSGRSVLIGALAFCTSSTSSALSQTADNLPRLFVSKSKALSIANDTSNASFTKFTSSLLKAWINFLLPSTCTALDNLNQTDGILHQIMQHQNQRSL